MKIIFLSSIFYPAFAMEKLSFDIYEQVKNISPEAGSDEYALLVMNLHDIGLSVYECISNLCEQRIEKAKLAIEKEWGITKHDWDNIEKKMESIKVQDSQQETLIIALDPKLEELQKGIGDLIGQKLCEAGCKGTFHLNYIPSKIDNRGFSRFFDVFISRNIEAEEIPIDYENKKIKYKIITAGDFKIEIGLPFFEYGPEEQEGCLLHEIRGHIVYNDAIRGALLSTTVCIYKTELMKDRLPFRKSDSVMTRLRAIEARADLIPAACMTAHEARLIEAWHTSNNKKTISHDDDHYHHDPVAKRLAMAIRIRKLKEAEEQLISRRMI